MRWSAAVGSDHPELSVARVEQAFAALRGGADVVLGPGGGRRLLPDRAAPRGRRAAPVRGHRLEHRRRCCRRPWRAAASWGSPSQLLPRGVGRRHAGGPARGSRLRMADGATSAARAPARCSRRGTCSLPANRRERRAMRVLTAEAMREVDRAAIEELGMPGPGADGERRHRRRRGARRALTGGGVGGDLLRPGQQRRRRPGGGAPSRRARLRGADLPGPRRQARLAPTPRPQLAICRAARTGGARSVGRRGAELAAALAAAAECDLVVDALFGTGLAAAARRALRRARWRRSTSCAVPVRGGRPAERPRRQPGAAARAARRGRPHGDLRGAQGGARAAAGRRRGGRDGGGRPRHSAAS